MRYYQIQFKKIIGLRGQFADPLPGGERKICDKCRAGFPPDGGRDQKQDGDGACSEGGKPVAGSHWQEPASGQGWWLLLIAKCFFAPAYADQPLQPPSWPVGAQARTKSRDKFGTATPSQYSV